MAILVSGISTAVTHEGKPLPESPVDFRSDGTIGFNSAHELRRLVRLEYPALFGIEYNAVGRARVRCCSDPCGFQFSRTSTEAKGKRKFPHVSKINVRILAHCRFWMPVIAFESVWCIFVAVAAALVVSATPYFATHHEEVKGPIFSSDHKIVQFNRIGGNYSNKTYIEGLSDAVGQGNPGATKAIDQLKSFVASPSR
jgi:hypothetical protein